MTGSRRHVAYDLRSIMRDIESIAHALVLCDAHGNIDRVFLARCRHLTDRLGADHGVVGKKQAPNFRIYVI